SHSGRPGTLRKKNYFFCGGTYRSVRSRAERSSTSRAELSAPTWLQATWPCLSSRTRVGRLATEKASVALPSSSTTGKPRPFCSRNSRTCASRSADGSSVSTEYNSTPRFWYSRQSFCTRGIEARQGPHQVAQKSTIVTFPC